MPTLHWIGKDKVINHHLDVPYKVLEHQYRFSAPSPVEKAGDEANKIIHGDNLEALKSLLPEYEGKIKCIYIDPPYNTGNESWVYNDNVNDPKIKKWLGNVVGKEAEDLTRHDKWLCMMYPRLKLLHKLLADDGIILVSIDDFEFGILKILLDEIYGNLGLFATFVWRRRVSSSMAASWISKDHEYVLAYSKNPEKVFVRGEERDMEKYNIPNEEGRLYASMPLTVGMTKDMRPNQWYELINPKTGRGFWPSSGRVWGYYPPTMKLKIEQNLIIFPDDYPDKKLNTPRLKSYPEDAKRDRKPLSTWIFEQNQELDSFEVNILKTSKNEEGTRVLKTMFGDSVFSYAKPLSLIQSLISQFTKNEDIILDSFAGSGTTAHAVLNLNKQDGGNRKFILIEMETYAETITAERVKRVINGYGNTEGTGGSFDFYTLGEPLFLEDGLLNENLPLQKIREYIWYTETQTNYKLRVMSDEREKSDELRMMSDELGNDDDASSLITHNSSFINKKASYLGTNQNTAYYFYYHPQEITTLDHDFLAAIQTKAEQYLIYADNCLLTPNYMAKNSIVFKKIPRDIRRF